LVAAPEVEPRDVLAGIHLALPQLDRVEAAADLLPDRGRRVEVGARLVDVRELNRVADAQYTPVRGLLAGDHPEQGRLPRAVRPDDADDPGGRKRKREVLDEQPVAESLLHALGLDDDVSEARARRDVDLDLVELDALLLCIQALVRRQAGLRLVVPGARAHAHPLELARERAAPRRLGLLLDREPPLLLLEPGGVIALERDAAAAVE